MLQPDENEIFGLFRKGDKYAYKHFFDKYSKSLKLFALRCFDNEDDAEDAVAHAFYKLYLLRESIKAVKHIEPWLYTVVKNKAVDYRRHRSVVARADEEMGNLQELAEKEDPELERIEIATINHMHDLLHKAIDRLPARRQQVIRLYFFQQKTTAEIADQLDISKQSVLNAKTKAIEALRKKLHFDISTYFPES
jgi:RNA polymerase sigma-70 factor (family 1)